jgi:hypothetical protein
MPCDLTRFGDCVDIIDRVEALVAGIGGEESAASSTTISARIKGNRLQRGETPQAQAKGRPQCRSVGKLVPVMKVLRPIHSGAVGLRRAWLSLPQTPRQGSVSQPR